jgi:uncharacterized protein (TIRG00374 family)
VSDVPVSPTEGAGERPAPAQHPTGPLVKRGRRRIPRSVRRVAGVLVAVVLIYFVLAKLGTQKGHFSLLAHINFVFVAAGLALEAGSLLAYALLTRAILCQFGQPPKLGTLVQIDMSTLALTRVLPGGSAAGTGLGYRLLTATGIDKADAGLTLAVQSIGSAVILNSLLWIGLVISIPLRALVHTAGSTNAVPKIFYVGAALVGAVLVGFFGFVVLSLTRGERKSLHLVRAFARRLRFLNEDAVVSLVERIADQLRLMASNRKLLTEAILWGSANWLLDAGALWVLLAAFHYHLAPDALLICYSLANIAAVIPLTPGGIGVVELVLTTALVAFGASHEVAGLGVIAYRLVSFWLPIPLGGVAYLTLRLNPRFREKQTAKAGPAAEF